jgi:iron complex transport system ATP-binding protein
MIEARGLRFRYRRGREAVSGVDLEIPPAALVGIIGPNGSGKSTLLKLLAGLLRPEEGTVRIAGRAVEEYDRRQMALLVSYVPQEASVSLPFTAGEIVLMGRHPHLGPLGFESRTDLEAVREALDLTEAASLATRPFESLSGGEKQRVLIARAIAQDAPLLLLDEPTAALDLKHEVRAWEILERLVIDKRKTVVSVTHQINLASLFSPRLLIMKEGKLVAGGPPDVLLRQELMESVYETAVRVELLPGRAPSVLPERRR